MSVNLFYTSLGFICVYILKMTFRVSFHSLSSTDTAYLVICLIHIMMMKIIIKPNLYLLYFIINIYKIKFAKLFLILTQLNMFPVAYHSSLTFGEQLRPHRWNQDQITETNVRINMLMHNEASYDSWPHRTHRAFDLRICLILFTKTFLSKHMRYISIYAAVHFK